MIFVSRPYNPPPLLPIEYVYEDADLLVVAKPHGLLSVPGKGEAKSDCLVARVHADYPEALIVHRLDMETSGVMVLARNKMMHRQLSMLFQNRQVKKTYHAIVSGAVSVSRGTIELPLSVDWPNKPLQKIDFIGGKASVTDYHCLSYDALSNSSRLVLYPMTGRTHQLRVHLFAIGHPILGDHLYRCNASQHRASRLLLHASQLQLVHPRTRQAHCWQCAPVF